MADSAFSLPAGLRATRAARALLALWQDQPQGCWTEAQVEQLLADQGVAVNRVTVYRALDRFVQAGLLAKQVDADRLGRYRRAPATLDGQGAVPAVPELECQSCHQRTPLASGQGEAAQRILAAWQGLCQALAQGPGLAPTPLDLAVRGHCPSCSAV